MVIYYYRAAIVAAHGRNKMTNFALNHEGKWRDGEASKISGATYVVSYDQSNQAYHIDKSDYDDFVEWVAETWQIDTNPREEDEEAEDYLERIDCSIREV